MNKSFSDNAWEEYTNWQIQDKKTLKRINALIKDISRNPYSGIGKPELLKGNWSGFWSRRIDAANRIIYKIEDEQLIIVQCGSHYGTD
jgi:toxin YoeB